MTFCGGAPVVARVLGERALVLAGSRLRVAPAFTRREEGGGRGGPVAGSSGEQGGRDWGGSSRTGGGRGVPTTSPSLVKSCVGG